MRPYVPPPRNKERGQRPDGKGPSHPSTGRPRRKAVSRPSRCSGPPRSGRRVWGSSWARGARPSGKGAATASRPHRRPRPSRPHRAPPDARGPAGPRSLRGRERAPARPRHPPLVRHHDGVEHVLTPGHGGRARPALPLARRPPPARPGRPLTAAATAAEARPLPGTAARGRPGKDGTREGPAGARGARTHARRPREGGAGAGEVQRPLRAPRLRVLRGTRLQVSASCSFYAGAVEKILKGKAVYFTP